jgi:hypothetical protein
MINQTIIADALGMTRQGVSKLKKQGMPVDSIKSAQAWRVNRQNVAARKPLPQLAERLTYKPHLSIILSTAKGLLHMAHASLQAGVDIEPMVKHIQAAMRAVPVSERCNLCLPLVVVMVLLKPTLDMLPQRADKPLNADGSDYYCDGNLMSDADAESAGVLWYEFACGEWCLPIGAWRAIHEGIGYAK